MGRDKTRSGRNGQIALAHEQFPVPQLAAIGIRAAEAGFGLLATSD
jgi:hypothetical protein